MTDEAPGHGRVDVEPQRREFGARLRQVRESRGDTQATVANAISVSRPFYSQVERGENNVSLEYVFRLAHYFAIPVADLFTVRDSPSSSSQEES